MANEIYAITPNWENLSNPISQINSLLQAGCKILQYRDKTANSNERHYRASLLLEQCRLYQAKLIINDDLELALKLNADGVHLGAEDGNWIKAKELISDEMILGVTCHDRLDLLNMAVDAKVSYVAFGAIFASGGKPQAKIGDFTNFNNLFAKAKQLTLKTCAIGGINPVNIVEVAKLQPDYIAIISALFNGEQQQISDNFNKIKLILEKRVNIN